MHETLRMQMDSKGNPDVDAGTRRLWGLILACPGLLLVALLLLLGMVQSLGEWESNAYPLFPLTAFLLFISPVGVLVSRGAARCIAAVCAAASYAMLAWVLLSIR